MKTINIQSTIESYALATELSSSDQWLIAKAYEATKNSYSPYSNFRVGASVLLADGTVVLGSNQENAAYPSGLCAERVALFALGAAHGNVVVESLAVVVQSDVYKVDEPISPCGACLQVLVEQERRQQSPIRIILVGTNEIYLINGTKNLLPIQFDLVKR